MSNNEIDIFALNIDDKTIDEKLEKAKQIYSDKKQYNEVHLAYKLGLIDGLKMKYNIK